MTNSESFRTSRRRSVGVSVLSTAIPQTWDRRYSFLPLFVRRRRRGNHRRGWTPGFWLLAKFLLQIFHYRSELALSFFVQLLTKPALDSPPLLQITAFVKRALLRFQLQAGLLDRRVRFPLHPLAAHILTIAQGALFLRRHAQPAFRV